MDVKTKEVVISVPDFAEPFGIVMSDASKTTQAAEEKRAEIDAAVDATKAKMGKYIAELYAPLRKYASTLSIKFARANSKAGIFNIPEFRGYDFENAEMFCYPRFPKNGTIFTSEANGVNRALWDVTRVTFLSDNSDYCKFYTYGGELYDHSPAGFLTVVVDGNGSLTYDEKSLIFNTLRKMKEDESFEVASTLFLARNWELVKELMNSGIQNWMNSIRGEANGNLKDATAQMEVLSAFVV